MAETFDAYHRWLGIPPHEQPPNRYRLLGIQLFEDSPEVIEAAADRQMGHLRTYQTGAHAELSQRLLNEVSAARVCLLSPHKKAAYDQALRQELEVRTGAVARVQPQQVAAAPWANPVEESPSLPEFGDRFPSASVRSVTRGRRRHSQVLLAAALVGIVILLGLVLWGLNTGKTGPDAPRGTAESPDGTDYGGLPRPKESRDSAQPLPSHTPAPQPGGEPATQHEGSAGAGGESEQATSVPEPAPERKMPPDRGLLLLDWPSEQRPGVDVRIDGQRQEVPSSGFVEYALPPGTHRLQMHRPGYEPIDEQILVPVGRRREYRPEWLALRASSPAGLRGIFGSEAGPSVPAPLPPQETPALRMDGPVRVEPRPGQGIAAPVLATVQPVLLGEGIGPLAPSLKGNLTVGCTVLEIGKHGARSIELRNLEYEKVAKILAGTLRVDVRFNFVRRGGDSLDSNQRVAESEWHTINPLQAGCNHVVRMELSRQQVQQLRALGQAVAPR